MLVMYFDQRNACLHRCKCACVRMVENNKKCYKIFKNTLFSSCVREAHLRLMYANPVNFVFVWVPITWDKVVKVQEPLPNRLIKQQQEVDS